MVAGSLAASALYNRRQRKNAEAQAAPQWRLLSEGQMLVSTARILVAGESLINLFYPDLDYAAHELIPTIGGGVRLGANGSDPLFLAVGPQSLWLYILITYLARGQVLRFALSEGLRRKCLASREKDLPPLNSAGQQVQLSPSIVGEG